jgi:hypothetical protein
VNRRTCHPARAVGAAPSPRLARARRRRRRRTYVDGTMKIVLVSLKDARAWLPSAAWPGRHRRRPRTVAMGSACPGRPPRTWSQASRRSTAQTCPLQRPAGQPTAMPEPAATPYPPPIRSPIPSPIGDRVAERHRPSRRAPPIHRPPISAHPHRVRKKHARWPRIVSDWIGGMVCRAHRAGEKAVAGRLARAPLRPITSI